MMYSLRLALTAGVLAALPLAPATLHAQATPAPAPASASDSLTFPRRFVGWVFSGHGDSVFVHSGDKLRESMKSAAGVNEMASNILGRFGAMQGPDNEVQFDEGDLKVYIGVMHFDGAPEPLAWIVAYAPATGIVERSSFGALSRVKTRYPLAKLP